jgi:hypothetical protein
VPETTDVLESTQSTQSTQSTPIPSSFVLPYDIKSNVKMHYKELINACSNESDKEVLDSLIIYFVVTDAVCYTEGFKDDLISRIKEVPYTMEPNEEDNIRSRIKYIMELSIEKKTKDADELVNIVVAEQRQAETVLENLDLTLSMWEALPEAITVGNNPISVEIAEPEVIPEVMAVVFTVEAEPILEKTIVVAEPLVLKVEAISVAPVAITVEAEPVVVPQIMENPPIITYEQIQEFQREYGKLILELNDTRSVSETHKTLMNFSLEHVKWSPEQITALMTEWPMVNKFRSKELIEKERTIRDLLISASEALHFHDIKTVGEANAFINEARFGGLNIVEDVDKSSIMAEEQITAALAKNYDRLISIFEQRRYTKVEENQIIVDFVLKYAPTSSRSEGFPDKLSKVLEAIPMLWEDSCIKKEELIRSKIEALWFYMGFADGNINTVDRARLVKEIANYNSINDVGIVEKRPTAGDIKVTGAEMEEMFKQHYTNTKLPVRLSEQEIKDNCKAFDLNEKNVYVQPLVTSDFAGHYKKLITSLEATSYKGKGVDKEIVKFVQTQGQCFTVEQMESLIELMNKIPFKNKQAEVIVRTMIQHGIELSFKHNLRSMDTLLPEFTKDVSVASEIKCLIGSDSVKVNTMKKVYTGFIKNLESQGVNEKKTLSELVVDFVLKHCQTKIPAFGGLILEKIKETPFSKTGDQESEETVRQMIEVIITVMNKHNIRDAASLVNEVTKTLYDDVDPKSMTSFTSFDKSYIEVVWKTPDQSYVEARTATLEWVLRSNEMCDPEITKLWSRTVGELGQNRRVPDFTNTFMKKALYHQDAAERAQYRHLMAGLIAYDEAMAMSLDPLYNKTFNMKDIVIRYDSIYHGLEAQAKKKI